jgi:uncharacterized protein YjbJ (UPF0337 family)
MKSKSRDKAEGTVDKVAGRVLEVFSKLTGKRSAGAKGKGKRQGAYARPREERQPQEVGSPPFGLTRLLGG